MSLITPAAIIPALGAAFGGGYFAGLHPTEPGYALVVAPKADGEAAALEWGGYGAKTAARSLHDGYVNSEAINDNDHPAAQFCRGLSIGGLGDWYLPSRTELNRLAEVFMPSEGGNPEQTTIAAFQDGGPEAFEEEWYWSSTEFSPGYAWLQTFSLGIQDYDLKDFRTRVRAVRKCPL